MTSPCDLTDLETPSLLLCLPTFDRNIRRMTQRFDGRGASLRPHIKTVKSAPAWRRVFHGQPPENHRVTVSTLREAAYAADHGVRDILYAVGVTPNKLPWALSIMKRGVNLTLTVDSASAARAIAQAGAAAGVTVPVVVEIDCDHQRAGLPPRSPDTLAIAQYLNSAEGASFSGVMTHAGGAYHCRSVVDITAMAERERLAVTQTASFLAKNDLPSDIVSIGSTPTAMFGERFDGVTEVRAGVFMTMDLVMAGLGVCSIDDIAISVLTSVIGWQTDRGQLLVDAGWMAMSRDRGTADQAVDHGYGLVCDEQGAPFPDLIMTGANQEHGILTRRDGGPIDFAAFPVGRLLRILPNHACATAAQFSAYAVLDADGSVSAHWPRINGW